MTVFRQTAYNVSVVPSDPADVFIFTFDPFKSVSLATDAVRTLEVGTVDYQVPVGKKTYVCGVRNAYGYDGYPCYTGYGDSANSNTNWVTIGDFMAGNGGSSSTTVDRDTLHGITAAPEGKYVGVSPEAWGTQSISFEYMMGIEVDA